MNRTLLAVIAAISVLLVVVTFRIPHRMISPGPLVSGHQDLTRDCFACHVPFLGVASEKCITCHKIDDIGLRTTSGEAILNTTKVPFHQKLQENECTTCHIDHSGARLAHNPHTFSHSLLVTDVREQCESCHVPPQDDTHQMITTDCAQCHQTGAWHALSFDHDKLFELDGDHDASCVTCHVNNVFTEFTCYGCHEHTTANIKRRHEREGINDFENCVECHRNAHDEPDED